jgi:hypothetical protein
MTGFSWKFGLDVLKKILDFKNRFYKRKRGGDEIIAWDYRV